MYVYIYSQQYIILVREITFETEFGIQKRWLRQPPIQFSGTPLHTFPKILLIKLRVTCFSEIKSNDPKIILSFTSILHSVHRIKVENDDLVSYVSVQLIFVFN